MSYTQRLTTSLGPRLAYVCRLWCTSSTAGSGEACGCVGAATAKVSRKVEQLNDSQTDASVALRKINSYQDKGGQGSSPVQRRRWRGVAELKRRLKVAT